MGGYEDLKKDHCQRRTSQLLILRSSDLPTSRRRTSQPPNFSTSDLPANRSLYREYPLRTLAIWNMRCQRIFRRKIQNLHFLCTLCVQSLEVYAGRDEALNLGGSEVRKKIYCLRPTSQLLNLRSSRNFILCTIDKCVIEFNAYSGPLIFYTMKYHIIIVDLQFFLPLIYSTPIAFFFVVC